MKVMQKRDMIIVFVLLLVALGTFVGYRFINSKKMPKAEIYYGTRLIETIQLDTQKDKVFSFPQNENVVFHLYEDGSICFEKSNCKDQICVHSGRLYQAGESAACLPNEFILKLVPNENHQLDEPDLIQ